VVVDSCRLHALLGAREAGRGRDTR
jgi:hypothetical protein